MSTVVGTLYRKSVMRDLSGNIRNWRDEANGGWIIHNYQVVNQERYNEELKKEEDKRSAATAQSQAVVASVPIEQRNAPPGKVEELEKRINEQDKKLDKILELLNK